MLKKNLRCGKIFLNLSSDKYNQLKTENVINCLYDGSSTRNRRYSASVSRFYVKKAFSMALLEPKVIESSPSAGKLFSANAKLDRIQSKGILQYVSI